MKPEFAITKNVQRFISGVELVNTPIKGRIGNGLFYGAPGTGKTEVGQWYAAQNDVPYIRAKEITSRRSLLANIASEIGEAPAYRTEDLFNQIVDYLIERPMPIIIDEVDYLLRGGAVEILRDINDMTNSPIIMMGMEHIDKNLRRFRHLYDRFTAIVRFELFDNAEIASLAGQICAAKLDESAVAFIGRQSGGKLRLITTWFVRAEQLASRNRLESISDDHLNQWLARAK